MNMRLAILFSCLSTFGFSSDLEKITEQFHFIIDPLPPQEEAALLPSRLSYATFGSQNTFIATEQVITDHLNQKRYAPRVSKPSQTATQDGSDLFKSCPSKGFFSGWLGAFGEYASEKLQRDVAAFRFNVGGVVVGVDYNCANDDVLGFGAGYGYTHVSEDANAGDANVNQGMWGFYSLLHWNDWYFDLGFWSGYYHTADTRNIPLSNGSVSTMDSTTHGWQIVPHAEIGYEGYLSQVCHERWFGVGPFLLADWVANWEDGFTEHGGAPFNMQIKGRFCSLFRGETGLRLHEIVKYSWGNLVFEQKGSYAYQKMFGTGTLNASFVAAPTFLTFHTLLSGQNLGVGEFSVIFQPLNRKWPFGSLRYQGQFGSKFQTHQGIVEIGKDF